MFWEEEKNENSPYVVPDDVVDLIYNIKCRALPLDHAHSLSQAIIEHLDWMVEEPNAGIHLIHGAESGNGWMRPDDTENQLLQLSHRARMTLRVPKHRIESAQQLTGVTLEIEGHALAVGKAKTKLFSTLPTQFARYVVVPEAIESQDEAAFLEYTAQELKSLDIKIRKMLCGRTHSFRIPGNSLNTRSIMLADLNVEEAVTLQQRGIGDQQAMGCGLFIPHKGVKAVHEMTADRAK
jgi:CRISPR-associated protein Cas6